MGGDKSLWDIFWESSLSTYGVGSTRFKNPVFWALLGKIDEMLGSGEDKIVLDVGCGTGVKSILMALKGAKVRGFDVDPNAISNCQKNVEILGKDVDVKFYVWDIQRGIPSKYRGTVDFILCNQVIEHVENYEKAIDEMIGALKPNGRVLITTPNKLTHMPKHGEKVFGEKKHGHYHAFSRDDLKTVAARRKDAEIEELTTHNVALPLTVRTLYKIFTAIDSFQRLVQKIGKKKWNSLEAAYVAITGAFVKLCNSLVYPSILNSYRAGEMGIKRDEGGTIYLVLKKRV